MNASQLQLPRRSLRIQLQAGRHQYNCLQEICSIVSDRCAATVAQFDINVLLLWCFQH